jgi:DNA-binding NarL/FixJ family response regulator
MMRVRAGKFCANIRELKRRSVDLRVAVIEDNPRYRQSLETLFAHAPGFALAGSYGSAEAAFDELDQLQLRGREPDWGIVVMDLGLPGAGGVEATRRLKKDFPQLPIAVFTVFEEPRTILEAICAGADGYLLKKSSATELTTQLRVIASGGAALTAGVARAVLSIVRATNTTAAPTAPVKATQLNLTEREQDVLRCLVQGFSYKETSRHLNISLDTVRSHIRAVYKKLQVHSVAEAVARAIREKLV